MILNICEHVYRITSTNFKTSNQFNFFKSLVYFFELLQVIYFLQILFKNFLCKNRSLFVFPKLKTQFQIVAVKNSSKPPNKIHMNVNYIGFK